MLISVALFGSNLPAFMVSQFPVRSRYSGIGIGDVDVMLLLVILFHFQEFNFV